MSDSPPVEVEPKFTSAREALRATLRGVVKELRAAWAKDLEIVRLTVKSDAAEIGELKRKFSEMEHKVAEIQSKGVVFRGVFQRADAETYRRGDLVTHQGSLWACVGMIRS